VRFAATEVGFADGLGGASNAKSREKYHYVLFGLNEDEQHPNRNGPYFEYDDQINGSVNGVRSIRIAEGDVTFLLKDGKSIAVTRDTTDAEWNDFLSGIRTVFGANATILD
jgi:hypothetical protein